MPIEMIYYLKSVFSKDLEIDCTIKTSFNGSPKQFIIDLSIDLTKALYSLFVANTGIMSLKEDSNMLNLTKVYHTNHRFYKTHHHTQVQQVLF